MWDGFIQGVNRVRQQEDQHNLSNINALSGLQGLAKTNVDAEAAIGQRQREATFRAKLSELGANPTHEQLRGLAIQSGLLAPKDMLANDLGMYKADATKELAVARLGQTKAEHDRQYELAKTKIENQAQAQALDAWYKQGNMQLKIAAAKYGLPPDIFDGANMPQMPAMRGTPPISAGSSQGGATISPAVTPAEIMRIPDPQERAQAMVALQAGRFSPDPVGAPVAPPASPAAAPTAPLNSLPTPPMAAPAQPAPEMGANEDMRDVMARRARQAAPEASALHGGGLVRPEAVIAPPAAVNQPLSAMSGAPQAPAAPTMADAPAGLSRKDKDKWLLQQSKPSMAGGGVMTPQALEFTAKQYLTGDRQAVQGFARSATQRIALQNAIVDEAAKQGLSPEQTAAKMAEFSGAMAGSRTVGQRAANISLAANEAQEMIGVVKEQSDKFPRSNFVPWNMALAAYESGTGKPEIAAFGASLNALVNIYARAINPTGVPTRSDKEHARAVINKIQSPDQVDAVLGIINRELEIAKKAPAAVRTQVRESIAPSGSGGKPPIDSFFK